MARQWSKKFTPEEERLKEIWDKQLGDGVLTEEEYTLAKEKGQVVLLNSVPTSKLLQLRENKVFTESVDEILKKR
jgi:hypothetical protein